MASKKSQSKKLTAKNKVAKLNNYYGNTTLAIVFFLFVIAIGVLILTKLQRPYQRPPIITLPNNNLANTNTQVAAFSSAEEFLSYLETGKDLASNISMPGMGIAKNSAQGRTEAMDVLSAPSAAPERVSTTNVQVAGVDEPDIVKTDGQTIYFSQEPGYRTYYDYEIMPMVRVGSSIVPPQYQTGKTSLIKAWPTKDVEFLTKIEKSGNLLLADNILAIFTGQEIVAYDVSDRTKPNKTWTAKFDDNNYLVSARLYQDKIYLVSQTYLNDFKPCPLKTLSIDDKNIEIACQEIYHPVSPTQVDTAFTAMTIDMKSGEINHKISFVGMASQSVVYMSTGNLFVTYQQPIDMFSFLTEFFREKMADLVPAELLARLDKINGYDIGQNAKLTEFYDVFGKWQNSLDKDTALKLENDMNNRLDDYLKINQRKLLNTGIVKIGIDDFKIKATGTVPGTPLNQFSLDEYQDNLRIATTLGNVWLGFTNSTNTANDVYVLDKNLKITGSIQDLGLGERIYAARFLSDKGYLVTFRQTDPFYVLNLADPKNPKLAGELKIPGYSSYLHQLANNRILGIGQEGSKVKLSYFDVSDPNKPKEISKYLLDEYWSEVSNNHHAFLQDAKHQIFFLPASQGGYVFSYDDDALSLEKAISLSAVKRAIYLNDYLYVLSSSAIKVYDENDWQEVKNLDLDTD